MTAMALRKAGIVICAGVLGVGAAVAAAACGEDRGEVRFEEATETSGTAPATETGGTETAPETETAP